MKKMAKIYGFYYQRFNTSGTHRELFLKSYLTKLKSDCIYHFPIDVKPNERLFAVSNQSENDKYILISV